MQSPLPFTIRFADGSTSKSLPTRWLEAGVQLLGAAFVVAIYTPDVAPIIETTTRAIRIVRFLCMAAAPQRKSANRGP
jgi:hypothetical protein